MKKHYLKITLLGGLLIPALMACQPPPGQGRKNMSAAEKGQAAFMEPREERPFLAPVMAEHVTRGEILSTIACTGSVVPFRSALLRTQESGRLYFTKNWNEGDFVSKGEVIARIESETLKGDIARAQADVALQEENLDIGHKAMEQAVHEYEIIQELYSKGIAAQKEVGSQKLNMDRAINSHRQNQINLDKAKASLNTLTDRLELLEVIAPFDGVLMTRATLEGTKPFSGAFGTESITDNSGRMVSSDYAVCGIADTSKVMLRCDVTSKDVGKVRLEQDAKALIYATTDIAVEGKVIEIGKSVNQETRAFQVDILVDNPDRLLKPGMFGRVDIVTNRQRDSISIAKDLITRRNNRDVVFVVTRGDKEYDVAREVPLELGLEGRDRIEVTWGLKEGDAIITRGFEVLQDNTPVTAVYTDAPAVSEEKKPEEEKDQAEKKEEKENGELSLASVKKDRRG